MLQRAVQLAGGERELARHLQVPMGELSVWLRGDDEPTQIVFLRAVDLLAEQSSSSEEPLPASHGAEPAKGSGASEAG